MNKKVKPVVNSVICVLLIIMLDSCAKEIAPSGGPRDVLPPEIVYVEPDSNLLNFNADWITFRFNEFFTLKNPGQNIFLSPLHDSEIKYRIKGKKLHIHVPGSLMTNKTYSLVLNNVIADYNEGNLLPKLEYNFSTGPYFDSLSLQGRVVDAFTAEGKENVNMYLFPVATDSVLMKKQFAYFSVSATGGQFIFNNLPDGEYQLYALMDKDFSHTYNSMEEMPGFYSENVSVKVRVVGDSVESNMNILKSPILVFMEEDTILKVSKSLRARKGLQHIIFNNPVKSASAVPAETLVADSILTTLNATGDTLSIWFIGEKKQVAGFVISANEHVVDTISLSLRYTGRGVADETHAAPKIRAVNIFDTDRLHFTDTLRFLSSNPLAEILPENIQITSDFDSIKFEIIHSDQHPLEFSVVFESVENKKYSVVFHKNAVVDCFGGVNDSTFVRVHTTDAEYYGKLNLKLIDFAEECYFFELENLGNKIKYIHHYQDVRESYEFSELIPGEYGLKLIIDRNCNRKWDTGVFKTRHLPETVYRMSGKVTVISNWDAEITWSFD